MHCFREFTWLPASKTGAEIAILRLMLVSQVTCLVAGFKKSAEITVLGLIGVSQEKRRSYFQNIQDLK